MSVDKSKKRKYARYPIIFGKLDLKGLVDVAKSEGMEIISADKPDMHVCAEIGLYGTPQAMESTEKEWEVQGHKIKKSAKRRGLVFGVNLNRPRAEWMDNQKVEVEMILDTMGIYKKKLCKKRGWQIGN